jgi:hypothetical protein
MRSVLVGKLVIAPNAGSRPQTAVHVRDYFRGMFNHRTFVAGILMFGLMAMSQARELGTRWRLHVENLKHQVKVEATIRFTKETAYSCMSGTWRRVVVEARTVRDEKFFPLAEPLAYKLDGGNVTLGRTTICDGYLFLSGKSDAADIHGTYDAVSIGGGRKLGYFSLKRIR